MKKFIVDTGDKKYKVEANDAQHATKLVKLLQKDTGFRILMNSPHGTDYVGHADTEEEAKAKVKMYSERDKDNPYRSYYYVKDSVKDEASPLQTVNALLEDERAAVDAYNVALENLKGKIPDESYAAIEAIRNDENRHIENLQAVVNGNVTEKNLEDSVKDALVARLYKSALGDPNYRRVQLLLDGKEVASLTQNEARALAAKISELANSATN